MSVVNNNHVKITDYLPTKAQLVRGMGYAAAGTCNIAALGAAYIATTQAAKRAECMTGVPLNEISFEAKILALDTPGTYALVPAAFAVAAIGFYKLAPKIHAYTTALAQTLETAPKKPIVMDSELIEESSEIVKSKAEIGSSVISDEYVSESDDEIEAAVASDIKATVITDVKAT